MPAVRQSILFRLAASLGSVFGSLLLVCTFATAQDAAAVDPQKLADQGRVLLQAYRKENPPNAALLAKAVVLFTSSKAEFMKAGDTDAVAEMEANLAWCQAQTPAGATTPAPEAPAPKVVPTLFMLPAPAPAAKRTPFPSETERKPSLDQIRSLYASEYAQHTETARRHLAAKLLREAGRNQTDPVAKAAFLAEACKVALDGGDYLTVLAAVDAEIVDFSGLDALAEKQAWLKKATAKVVPTAIATLLVTPMDSAANLVVGKYCALELGRLEDAVPMLALCTDLTLRAAAENDLAAPDEGLGAAVTGDGWYQLVKSGMGSAERFAWLRRAQHWYLKAKPTVDGLVKKRVDTRLAEIDKILPLDLDKLDWKALTPTQWDKLKGVTCVVQMRVARSGPFAQLAAGQTLRVVPHPSDQWTLETRNGKFTSTWTGLVPQRPKPNEPPPVPLPRPSNRGFFAGELLMQIGDNPLQRAALCEGPGALWLVPNRSNAATSTGEIRVKLIPLDD